MAKLLQIFSTIFVVGVIPTLILDRISNSGYLEKFMADQSLSLIGNILAIYLAVASSFIAILNSYEDEQGRSIFTSTVKELKQNIIFVFVVFILHFFLLVGTPKEAILCLSTILKGAKTFTLMLFIYALYELSAELFTIKNKLPKKDKKQ